jgi:hypothetical protein
LRRRRDAGASRAEIFTHSQPPSHRAVPACDDFTKVEPNSAFHDDVHYSLMFNSVGLTTRACEWVAPLIPDAKTGVNECTGAVDCSFTLP